jgi:hypothetical protein
MIEAPKEGNMRIILLAILMSCSFLSIAGMKPTSSGAPVVPCYVDGEYQGTMEIYLCDSRGGAYSK